MNRLTVVLLIAFTLQVPREGFSAEVPAVEAQEFDVVVYGGTSSGAVAAISVAKSGKSVVLVEPSGHVGGMTTGGLGNTDVGRTSTISGITLSFYEGLHDWYQKPSSWKYQEREDFLSTTHPKRVTEDAMFVFEPHVAEKHLNRMLETAGVPVALHERLDLDNGVTKTGAKIVSIRMESGRVFNGKVFLDCSYEGDLMAEAGVAYTVGREGNAKYDEKYNGVQTSESPRRGPKPLDPYVEPGNPSSGTIKQIQPDVVGQHGDGDKRVQAYNFRLCLTKVPENRTPFDKPEGYDEKEYELLFRWLEAGNTANLPFGVNPIPNQKTDSNKAGWVSTDYIGFADDYPDADHSERDRIVEAHVRYHKGFLWTLANHPRVSEDVRERASEWGYAKDEFLDNGNFPHQLYVREGRRMMGRTVLTEHELKKRREIVEPIAVGSYGMDSHPTQLWVDSEGALHADTPPWIGVGPYGISYLAITPKSEQCSNLLVPVCVSASHSAYGSIRMEPVYMMLGQAAGTAAVLAIEGASTVQAVPYDELSKQLIADDLLIEPIPKRR